MATFLGIAARSVSNLFSLYVVYLKYFFISRFGFKSGICLLIAHVPVHCFSITSRYLDDLLNIGDIHFEEMVHRIYPAEIQLNKANASDTEAAFLDLKLSIQHDSFYKIKY